jgi:hypothetical protein
VSWKISAKVVNVEATYNTTEDEMEAMQMSTVYYQLLKWWLDNCLDEVVICHIGDIVTLAFVEGGVSNDFMLLPTQPLDDIIGEAIFRKMTAISGEYLKVIDIKIYSDDFDSTFYYNEKAPRRLHSENESEIKPVFKQPWWDRNDLDIIDPVIPEDSTLEEVYEAVETASALEEVKEQILDMISGIMSDDEDDEDESEPEVVDVSKWKPRKI